MIYEHSISVWSICGPGRAIPLQRQDVLRGIREGVLPPLPVQNGVPIDQWPESVVEKLMAEIPIDARKDEASALRWLNGQLEARKIYLGLLANDYHRKI